MNPGHLSGDVGGEAVGRVGEQTTALPGEGVQEAAVSASGT